MDTERAKGRLGATLKDKYRLDAVIGIGGMAVVYRAAHRNGNRVAVKMLHPELSIIDDVRNRFLKEGYVANAVDHPGAVRVLDDDITDDGQVFLVMDLLEGDTLEDVLRRADPAGLPAKEVAEYAAQVLATLGAAHAQGIVHRDIKPENLFLTREGQVKVLDFGIARVRAGNAESMTRTGRMLGTPAFMPAEQALGLTKEIDGRSDLWAVGASMFTMISGQYVHPGETAESMLVFTATRPARPLHTVAPRVPTPLAKVIDRALAFNKTDRYADAPSMLHALQHAYRESFGVELAGVRRVRVAPIDAPAPAARSTVAAPIVSTTAGVSGHTLAMPAPAAVRPSASSDSGPRRRGRALPILLVVFAVGGAIGGVTVVGGLRSRSAPVTAPGAVVVGASADRSASAVETAPPMPSAVPALSAVAVPSPSAAPAPSPQKPAVVKPARPAEPDCNPPVFYDPVSGKKKVKAGC